MARKATEQTSAASRMLEDITKAGEDSLPLDERLAVLARVRETGAESGAAIDRFLMERIAGLREALSTVQEQHGELRTLIKSLTAPPYFPAVYLTAANTPEVQGALVLTDNERRVVQVAEGVAAEQLAPGDEVFLSRERNFVVARSSSPSFLTGEVAAYSRSTEDGRMVLRSRDEEVVVLPKAALRGAGLKAGDGVRFSRSAGLAFEKIEASKGEEFFMEATPSDTFLEIGGLDREIESLKRLITLHTFHPATARRYKLSRKRSVLMEGPPGNGKTKVARATCNWLAGMSRSGRSQFINVKPGGLNSMWYGATEERYRTIFRIAREAAAADPDVPVVMFWDEVDAIGGSRGESVHRIDDRMLNAFMAELNGLEDRGNIVILAATNRLDSLDPALLRPGQAGRPGVALPSAARQGRARHSGPLPAGRYSVRRRWRRPGRGARSAARSGGSAVVRAEQRHRIGGSYAARRQAPHGEGRRPGERRATGIDCPGRAGTRLCSRGGGRASGRVQRGHERRYLRLLHHRAARAHAAQCAELPARSAAGCRRSPRRPGRAQSQSSSSLPRGGGVIMGKHASPDAAVDALPKLCGADIELGNFIAGINQFGGTGFEASHALLAEIEGLPARRNGYVESWWPAAAPAADAKSGSLAGACAPASDWAYNPQDVSRRFLASNGGSAYIDLCHAELCLPEVRSAFDHVAAWHGMLRIVRGALDRANEGRPRDRRIQVLVNNSDGQGNSYGSHLNFLISRQTFDNIFWRKAHYTTPTGALSRNWSA